MLKTEQQQAQRLLIIEDLQGQRAVSLESATYSLGRDSTNSIVLHSQFVSRRQAIMLRVPAPETGIYFFRIIDGDLQGRRSHNGMVINGKSCFSHDLQHGDLMEFGKDVKVKYQTAPNLPDSEILKGPEEDSSNPPSNSTVILQSLVPADLRPEDINEAALVRLASFPELIPNPILELDLSGKLTYVNPAAGNQFPDLQAAGLQHPLLRGLVSIFEQGAKVCVVREVEIGSKVFEQFIHCISESDLIRSYISDITERKQAEQALRESEERYALAAASTNDGLWDWDLNTSKIYFSPRWKTMLGCEETEVGNSPDEWFSRVHPEDIERVKEQLTDYFEGVSANFESEHRMLHKAGTYRWILSRGIAIRDASGKVYRMTGAQADVTERKIAEGKLLHDAFHDALTGLPNRTLFIQRLEQALNNANRRQDGLFAVLFLDLDRFKVVNDSLGHLIGDQLLTALVRRLEACVRPGDTVARLGGDEFTILLEAIQDVGDATVVADRIQKELTLPFNLSGHEVFITTSIGIALSTIGYDRPEDLLRDADTVMYRAKALGKARHEVFDKAMHAQAVTLLELENDLRRVVDRLLAEVSFEVSSVKKYQELQLYYQPIVSIETGTFTGFEALLRWNHLERGLISPDEFIPLAEETGLIIPIGYWVMREACRQMQVWQQEFPKNPPLMISVNLSGKQFSRPDLIEQIQQILRETGLSAYSLKLEITESILMENAESAAEMLLQLRALGVQLYIDDFGTGYSSLSYLHRFPVDALKIDRSFISRMGTNGENSEIIQTVMTLARNLNIDVVAEGVETAEQLTQLRAMGCKHGQGQGYFFSKPVDSETAQALIAAEPQGFKQVDTLRNS